MAKYTSTTCAAALVRQRTWLPQGPPHAPHPGNTPEVSMSGEWGPRAAPPRTRGGGGRHRPGPSTDRVFYNDCPVVGPPPSKTAAARMAVSLPHLLFKLSITLEGGKEEVLAVFEGDDPTDVAARFAAVHGLPVAAVHQLRDSVFANLGTVLPPLLEQHRGGGGGEDDTVPVSQWRGRWDAGSVGGSTPRSRRSAAPAPPYGTSSAQQQPPPYPAVPDRPNWERSLRFDPADKPARRRVSPQGRPATRGYVPVPPPPVPRHSHQFQQQHDSYLNTSSFGGDRDEGKADLARSWRPLGPAPLVPQATTTPTRSRTPSRMDRSFATPAPGGGWEGTRRRATSPSWHQQHQPPAARPYGRTDTPLRRRAPAPPPVTPSRHRARSPASGTAYMRSLAAAASAHSAAAKAAQAVAHARHPHPMQDRFPRAPVDSHSVHAPTQYYTPQPLPSRELARVWQAESAREAVGELRSPCDDGSACGSGEDGNPTHPVPESPSHTAVSAAYFLRAVAGEEEGSVKPPAAAPAAPTLSDRFRRYGTPSSEVGNGDRPPSVVSSATLAQPMTLEEVAAARGLTPAVTDSRPPSTGSVSSSRGPHGMTPHLQSLLDRKRELIDSFRANAVRLS